MIVLQDRCDVEQGAVSSSRTLVSKTRDKEVATTTYGQIVSLVNPVVLLVYTCLTGLTCSLVALFTHSVYSARALLEVARAFLITRYIERRVR